MKDFLGGAWATPVLRTAFQAGLAVLVGAGAGFVDVEVWRTAAIAAGAALLAAVQGSLRAEA